MVLSVFTYSYDNAGNRMAVVDDDGALTTYSWDLENRMTKVEPTGGPMNAMTYDRDGKRRSYEDSVMLRKFIPPHARRASWEGENILCQTAGDDVRNQVQGLLRADDHLR